MIIQISTCKFMRNICCEKSVIYMPDIYVIERSLLLFFKRILILITGTILNHCIVTPITAWLSWRCMYPACHVSQLQRKTSLTDSVSAWSRHLIKECWEKERREDPPPVYTASPRLKDFFLCLCSFNPSIFHK